MNFEIKIYGFNDRAISMPEFFNEIKEYGWIGMWELPTNQEQGYKLFSTLNEKSNYEVPKNVFVEKVNSKLEEILWSKTARVNSSVIESIYETQGKFSFCYPVGCLTNCDDFIGFDAIDNIRYERSVKILENILDIINPIMERKETRVSILKDNYEKLKDFNGLKQEYYSNNATCFLKKIIYETMVYSENLEEITSDNVKKLISTILPMNFEKRVDGELYVNPAVFDSIFEEVKKEIPSEFKIFVGEPHRIFLEEILKQKFQNSKISSESFTLENYKTTKETKYVLKDLLKAKEEGLISNF